MVSPSIIVPSLASIVANEAPTSISNDASMGAVDADLLVDDGGEMSAQSFEVATEALAFVVSPPTIVLMYRRLLLLLQMRVLLLLAMMPLWGPSMTIYLLTTTDASTRRHQNLR